MDDAQIPYCGYCSVGVPLGLFAGVFRYHNRKFLTAITGNKIRRPLHGLFESSGHVPEHLVTGEVPIVIVVFLETIHIDQQEGEP